MREPIDRSGRSLAAIVADQAQRRPDETSVTVLERGEVVGIPFTYAALDAEARRVAALLEGHGLVGRRVMLMLPTGMPFIGALLGCLYAGVVAIPVPEPRPGVAQTRLAEIAVRAGAAAILVTTATHARTQAMQRTPLPAIAVDGPGPDDATARCLGLSTPHGRDVIHQYTSGSTRAPRGVRWTDACVVANAYLADVGWRLRERPVFVSWLPHYHDMGLVGGLLFPLLFGAPSVHFAPLEFVQRPVRWLQAISRYGGQVSGGPAFAFDLCLRTVREEDLATLSLASWDRAFCGAEAVRRETLAHFEDRFAVAGLPRGSTFACYGLAESSLFVAGDPNPLGLDDVTGAAAAASTDLAPCRLNAATDASIRIVDPATKRSVDGEEAGEIWVASPSVAVGYDGDPTSDATFAAHLRPDDGRAYLRTGDLGYRRNGFLVVTGRLKDVLLVNGVNVAASDVEWLAASQHELLNPHAAAAVHVGLLNQGDVGLVIEFVGKASPLVDEGAVIDRIRGAVLAEYGVTLRAVRLVPRGTLPRTTSGKVRRHVVRETLLPVVA